MKNSPFVRIREKNKEIKSLKETLVIISNILNCQPIEVDIIQAITNCKALESTITALTIENEDIRRNMGNVIANEVEKLTFNLQLENTNLKDKVASLQKILDNKTERPVKNPNQKGFWDFIYKVFKLV